ncbi:MAG TPA: GDSL-type esterase/lipase family protein [Cytophagaceae bacterium]|jgi:lysophospholipase L1-like esterase|nr:GDSL-type esterase/lipase family protein [Cytophagaceae bacterium]
MKGKYFIVTFFIGFVSIFITSFVNGPATIESGNHQKHTYLALGDAYVIGEGVQENERWPIQLEGALRGHEFHINYPYFVSSKTWTVDQLTQRLGEEEFDKHYDLITIQIGVNDEYKKKTISAFTTDVKALLTKVIALTGGKHGRVVFVSIPDWSVTPFAKKHKSDALDVLAENINKYNQVIKKETIAAGGHFVDITDISKKAATDPTLTSSDELHPSGAMYKLWVQRMYPTIIQALQMHRN